MAAFGPLPPVLKRMQPYLKIAEDHDEKDIVIAYWCRLYAVQSGLKINDKTKESSAYLFSIMDWLEKVKKEHHENEAISNEIVAQAHIENHAQKLFEYADSEDRAAKFHKNVVKAFYTAGLIYDVVSIFGEASEEVAHQKKYSKWKATYIHNCLKNGVTPIPGPVAMENDGESCEENSERSPSNTAAANNFNFTEHPPDVDPATSSSHQAPYPVGGLFANQGFQPAYPVPPVPGTHAPPSTPNNCSQPSPSLLSSYTVPSQASADGVSLQPEDFHKAQKYCKYAGSALQYEDVPTAVENLQKALLLLTTGKDE